MPSTNVLVLYNEPVLPASHPDFTSEHEILDTVSHVATALDREGFAVAQLGINSDPSPLLAGIREHRPDVVFNLFEGTGDQGGTEAYVAGVLEWLRVPFTGCPSHTLCLARGKHLTKPMITGRTVVDPGNQPMRPGKMWVALVCLGATIGIVRWVVAGAPPFGS